MRNAIKISVLLALALVAGCAISPRAQWKVASDSFSTAETTLAAASASGALNDKDFVATEQWVRASRAALDQADAELTANNDQITDKFRFYMGLVTPTLLQLQKPPTTKPSR